MCLSIFHHFENMSFPNKLKKWKSHDSVFLLDVQWAKNQSNAILDLKHYKNSMKFDNWKVWNSCENQLKYAFSGRLRPFEGPQQQTLLGTPGQ